METLTLDGKEFVKAKVIAKHLGYTSDYVGQLCRSGKLDAHLVGRTWYVQPDSIKAHKKERYRSNEAKSKAAVQRYQKAQSSVPRTTPRAAMVRPVHLSIHHYEEDTAELYPRVSKPEVASATETPPTFEVPITQTASAASPVVPAGEKISVQASTKATKLTPTERPKVTFKGKLSITTVEEQQTNEEPAPVVPRTNSESARRNKKPGNTKHIQVTSDPVEQADGYAVAVHTKPSSSKRSNWSALRMTLKLVLLTSFVAVCVLVTLATYQETTYSDGDVSTSYKLDFTNIAAFIPFKI